MKTMNETENDAKLNLTGKRLPALAFYHPNSKCTGGAVKFTVHPAHGVSEGFLEVLLASQMDVASGGAMPTFPKFDWENSITVKLDFTEVSKVLGVLRGYTESLEDGHGFVCVTPKAAAKVRFSHVIEPVVGYRLEAYSTDRATGEERAVQVMLTPAEAMGLSYALEGSLTAMAFGVWNGVENACNE